MASELTAGDRVRRKGVTHSPQGTVVLGRVPVPLVPEPAKLTGVPLEELCRVRWDGNTFGVVEDCRALAKVED
jgi:hypothetical protein